MTSRSVAAVLTLLLFVTACTSPRELTREPLRAPEPIPELPPVPRVDGPLNLELVYPTSGATRPAADSTFLFGNTGTGAAELTINGLPIAVAENGGFLAFVPVASRYTLVAEASGRRDTLVYRYRVPTPTPPAIESFGVRTPVVTSGKDTLATGSEIADAAPRPGADRRWFFPIGTQLRIDGKLANSDVYRVRLTDDTEAWISGAFIGFEEPLLAPRPHEGQIEDRGRYTDVLLTANFAPFLIEPGVDRVQITVYGPAGTPPTEPTDWFTSVQARTVADSTVLTLDLAGPLWGFKAFYTEDGSLIARLRRPPPIDPTNPLRGVRVLIDPGHPPGGAIGPTRLTEAEANLQISLRLEEKLRARGAEVLMTRTEPGGMVSDTNTATELWARVDSAVVWNADLMVSVHNNAFPDGVNPFEHYGSETYYFHAFSQPLAEALIREIAPVTGLPNLGAKQRSLALVRPAWLPSTLTESLFMMFPQQEAALRDPAFLDRLADAHVRGIEAFLRGSLRR